MNFLTQNVGHSYTPPVNFHLKFDNHFLHEGAAFKSSTRRLAGADDTVTVSSGPRHAPRPRSTHLDIPLQDLGVTGRSHSTGYLNNVHSLGPARSSSSRHVLGDDGLEQLLHRGENHVLGDDGLEQLHPRGDSLARAEEYLRPSCTEHLSQDHDCRLEGCQRVVINVSGLKFETQLRTLERLPHTLLGDPEKRNRYWDESRQEFFFDRHRPTFQAVLYYYQSGGWLKRPLEVPMDIFLNELMFYELSRSAIDSFKQNEGYVVEKKRATGPANTTMHKIWTMLEYPESSLTAKVFAALSVFFILVSVVTFCLETLPAFRDADCVNVTWVSGAGRQVSGQRPNTRHPLFITESCCIAWFVAELALRLAVSPSKLHFLRTAINWIDVVAILPYFVFLVLNMVSDGCNGGHKSSGLSVLRVLRVVRILKLSKHSEGLKILGMTLKTSIRELSMFLLFLGIATIIFSGAVYYAELEQPDSQFTSIPDSFWWAIVTMTTVGYGDFVPRGLAGKLLGGVCVLSGVLAIALPVPVIVANFNNYYRQYTGRGYR